MIVQNNYFPTNTLRVFHVETTWKRLYQGTSSNGSPPYLVVKMGNWEFSEKVKSAFIQENQNGPSQVFVSQMYLK